jgi:hypothetical protein
VFKGLTQKRTIRVSPLPAPPSSGSRVENYEVTTSGQKFTILSNVCSPLLYHSSRNG